jgi:pilus assembly protein Flp/PilA
LEARGKLPDLFGSFNDSAGSSNSLENEMLRLIRDLKSDKRGVTMIEYALIAGLVSVVAIAMLTAMGTSVNNLYSTINSALTTA